MSIPLRRFLHRVIFWPISPAVVSVLARPHRRPSVALQDAGFVLVVALDRIGDTLLLAPFLRELRKNCPKARLVCVCRPESEPLLFACPHIDEVHVLRGTKGRRGNPYVRFGRVLRLGLQLRGRYKFDWAFSTRWHVDEHYAAMLVFLAGAAVRVGFRTNANPMRKMWNPGISRLLTHACKGREGICHEYQRSLDLLEEVGGHISSRQMELWLLPKDREPAENILKPDGLTAQPYGVVAPGAGEAKRTWPVDRFVQVCSHLAAECGVKWVIVGNRDDSSKARMMKEAATGTFVDTTARLTITETAAIIERARIFLGNDSGPMHLAAALQIPCIIVSCHPSNGDPNGPNSPVRFGPVGDKHIVLCPSSSRQPCSQTCEATVPHCICEVNEQDVKNAVLATWLRESSK